MQKNNLKEHTISFTVKKPEHEGARLDTCLAEVLGIHSRSQLQHYQVRAASGGRSVKLSKKIRRGEQYEISYIEPQVPDVRPEEIPLSLLYEDEDVIVVDKPQGMVVHPAHGNYSGTLMQGLLYYCATISDNFTERCNRPGIVHRLDKDTSGVIITAKHPRAQEYLASQFRRRKVRKIYYGIVKGRPPQGDGIVDAALTRDKMHRKRFCVTEHGGKKAVTRYRVEQTFEGYSLLRLSPRTGRTHQLRVHCAHIGTPILGDPLYSRKDNSFPDAGLMLHAYSLKIRLPRDQAEHVFTVPLPERFTSFMSGF